METKKNVQKDVVSVYSFFDVKSEHYGPLFQCYTDDEAIRTFNQVIKKGNSNVSEYPQDFVLYRICEFNYANGHVVTIPTPYQVITGSEVAKSLFSSSLFNNQLNEEKGVELFETAKS